MSKERTSIGSSLFWPLLVIPPVSYGLLNLPFFAAKTMGANGYLGVIVAAVMSLPGLFAIHLLARRFPNKTIIEYGRVLLGPILGWFTGLFYLVFVLMLLAMFVRDQLNMAIAYFLDNTPLYVATGMLLLATTYLASRGIETVGRLACFLLIPAFAVMAVLLFAGFRNVSIQHLQPVLSPDASQYLTGGFEVLYIFYLVGTAAMILPFLAQPASFPRLAGGALLFLLATFVLFTAGAIGVYGHEHLARFAWPSLDYVHVINYPYFLLEQAGLLMMLDWIAMIYVSAGFLTFIVSLGAVQLAGRLDYKRFAWLFLPATFALVILPDSVVTTKKYFDLIRRAGFAFFFAYPILLWLISLVRGGRQGDAA